MAKRYFEYKDAKSKKFWEVSVSAKKVTIRYGKLGTDGQTSLKEPADGGEEIQFSSDGDTTHKGNLFNIFRGSDCMIGV